MAHELQDIYDKLRQLKDELRLLSYVKRTPERLKEKLNEATVVYNCYFVLLPIIRKKTDDDTLLYDDGQRCTLNLYNYVSSSLCDKIEECYLQIKEFCNMYNVLVTKDGRYELIGSTSNVEPKMDFNLNTALSLLPVMNNEDSSIHQLIDSIDYYSSTLKTEQCKLSLIKFVLKTRLSRQAKLKLKSDYPSIDALLSDMRMFLLPEFDRHVI